MYMYQGTTIAFDNVWSPVRRQAIIVNNGGLSLIRVIKAVSIKSYSKFKYFYSRNETEIVVCKMAAMLYPS